MRDEALAVAEKLHPRTAGRACSYKGAGCPVGQADQAGPALGVIVRGAATKDRHHYTHVIRPPKTRQNAKIHVKAKTGEPKSE